MFFFKLITFRVHRTTAFGFALFFLLAFIWFKSKDDPKKIILDGGQEAIVAVSGLRWKDEQFIVTLDQGKFFRDAVFCKTSSSSCAGERMGRFVIRCPCSGNELTVNGVLVEIVEEGSVLRHKKSLVGCSMIRGDDAYLIEWLKFHLFIGFDQLVLYSDEPEEKKRRETRSILAPFIKNGKVLFVDPLGETNPHRQFIALNHCIIRLRHESEWVAVFDVDEFFLLGRRTPDSMLEAISRSTHNLPSVGSLFVSQVFFGSRIDNENLGSTKVLERFLYREKEAHVGGTIVNGREMFVGKSITRPLLFRHLHTSHNVELIGGYSAVRLDPEDLRINHYWCKSKQEQSQREASSDSWRSKLVEWEALCEGSFAVEKDSEILRFSKVIDN